MNNFDIAEQALQTSLNSSGSAMEEHAKWQKSLEARILSLKASWQGLSQTFLSSDFLKKTLDGVILLVDGITKLIDSFGLLGTIGLGFSGFEIFKYFKDFKGDEVVETVAEAADAVSDIGDIVFDDTVYHAADAIDDVAGAAINGADAMGNLGNAVKGVNGGFKAFMKTPLGVASAIGLVVAAVGLAYNAYKNYKEEQAELRRETIETSDTFLESADSFRQAYIKYSGRTDLTADEEADLEAAINGTVEALDDKSSALQNAVNSSGDYVTSLERISEAERKAAKEAADRKLEAAEGDLHEAAIGWQSWDGSEVNVTIGDAASAEIAQEMQSKFVTHVETKKGRGQSWAVDRTTLNLLGDASPEQIVEYYDFLNEYQKKLKDAGLEDTATYTKVTDAIGKMTDAIGVYVDGVYDAAKAQYELDNGYPKTVDEYLKMREEILGGMGDMSVETRKTIAGSLDSEYSQYFDLSSAKVQSRKLIGVLDEYGDMEANEMETFLNVRTAVNNNECTVGEYLAQFNDINSMTADWSDESKKEIDTTFGLDTDKIKKQYEHAYNYIDRNYLKKLDTTGLHGFEALEYLNTERNRIQDLLKGLTANELAAVISLEGEINWENSADDILAQIKKEAEFIEAMNFTIAIDVEAESVEALNTAMAESVSATGLSSESIAALKSRYAELEDQGYDLSAMFEETSHGIHLNSEAVSELEQAYATDKLSETKGKLDTLKTRYDELTNEINNCSDASKRAALYREQQTIVQKINDLGTLASQYEGLASSYNAWLSAEEAGQERDMYEQIIEGFENIGDEISRGWLDDGTIKFLELMTGQTDLAGKSATELKEIWKGLDKNIKNTSYSVKDFFTVDGEGNSTSTGVYNFLKAIEELKKKGTLKAVKDEAGNLMDISKLIERNSDGKITAFNFDVVGGDEAVAEALGISEELVQIIQRAADDAGFVVTLDGSWTQFADLQNQAEEANDTLKKLAQTNDKLKEAGFGEYNFDFGADNIETISTELEKAKELLNNEAFKKDGKFNIEAEGAKEALKIAETLQITKSKLEEPAYMSIDTSKLQKELQEPVKQLQEFERLTQEKDLLNLTGTDTKRLGEIDTELNNIADKLSKLPKETKIDLGIDGMTPAQIREELENGTIEIPTELTIEANMDKSLEDLVTLGLLEQGLIDLDEAKVRLGLDVEVEAEEVDTSDYDNTVKSVIDADDKEKTRRSVEIIAETFGVEDVESLESELEGLDDKTIQAIAEVLGQADVDKLSHALSLVDPVYVEAIAKAIGEGDVNALKFAIIDIPQKKQIQAIAEALGYDSVIELNNAINGMDGNTVQAIAQALGITDVNTLQTAVDNMQGNTVDANVNTDGQSGKINALQSDIDGMRGNTVDIFINTWKTTYESVKKVAAAGANKAAQRTGADPDGKGSVNGTANVNGTTGRAFKQGSWGTKNSGTALVGELGRETLVRDGRYYTIGDTGAEFIKYQRGDIIFNHRQTEELFKNGKVTSGGGRAKALANGTAFAQGTAYLYGYGGGEEPEVPSFKIGYDYKASTDKDSEKSQELFDWIEVAIKRIEREIDRLDTKANSVYRSWSERNTNLVKEINTVGDEISLQKQAIVGYQQALNEIGLSQEYINKIKSGTIDIDNITDETLAEKIKDYQKWFEKILECEDAILELTEKEQDLIQQKFDNVIDRYDGYLSVIEHEKSMLEEYINQSEAQGWLTSTKYYDALIANERDNISMLRQEKAALLAQLGEYEDSAQWYENAAKIDEITLAIEQANTAILEWQASIEELKWEQFDLLQEKISAVTEEAEFLIELMSNKKLFEDNGRLTDEGMATMGLHGQNYNAYMYQADLAAEEAERLKNQLAKDPYDMELEERYREMISLQQEYILAAEDEKNAIRDLVENGIEYELDALQERIDLYNEALSSQKDLYDYQRNVEKQTKNIASLQKQIAAYSTDDSDESYAKVQELKLELEEAEADLKETEYEKFISDTSALLDTLYNEYELILNERLDNLDALIESMIIEINENASNISATLSETAINVGYDLSNDMETIWNANTASTNEVITTYGTNFLNAQTTTNNALNAIKSNLQNMISRLDSIASTKVTQANQSSVANPSNTEKPKSGSAGSGNAATPDGIPKVGEKVKFVSGKYYNSSDGLTPTGDELLGKGVYITIISNEKWSKKPYHIARDKAGTRPLGWVSLNQLSNYATGKKNFLNDEFAWTQEGGKQEYIIRPSDGAILTPIARKGSVLNAQASNNIWNMANTPAEFIRDNLNLDTANVPSGCNCQNVYSQNFENIVFSLPNVRNYEQLLTEMQRDKNFQNLIESMTINKLAGKSSLAKGKAIK